MTEETDEGFRRDSDLMVYYEVRLHALFSQLWSKRENVLNSIHKGGNYEIFWHICRYLTLKLKESVMQQQQNM